MPYHSETLSVAQKSQLCRLLLQNPSLNQVQLAEWAKRKYHLSKLPSHNTFFGILRNKPKWSTETMHLDRSNCNHTVLIFDKEIGMESNDVHSLQ